LIVDHKTTTVAAGVHAVTLDQDGAAARGGDGIRHGASTESDPRPEWLPGYPQIYGNISQR
jgi:hypothetical protein